jgi:hypothetical protein
VRRAWRLDPFDARPAVGAKSSVPKRAPAPPSRVATLASHLERCDLLDRRTCWRSVRRLGRSSGSGAFGSIAHVRNDHGPPYRENTGSEDSPVPTLRCNGRGVPHTWTGVPRCSYRTTSVMGPIRSAFSQDQTLPDLCCASTTSQSTRAPDQTSDLRREPLRNRHRTQSTATVSSPTQTSGGT